MKNKHLPIFKATLDLVIYIESIVKNQDRYYRYSIGTQMRELAQGMLFLINRANRNRGEKRVEFLEELTPYWKSYKSVFRQCIYE